MSVHALSPPRNRLQRVVGTFAELRHEALRRDAALYHFHDPELIPLGLELRARGKHVIYDVHENLPEAILSKPYLPTGSRIPIAAGAWVAERVMAAAASAIVTATPAISRRFPAAKTIPVQNYPLLNELESPASRPFRERDRTVVYAGGISAKRSVFEMVQAMSLIETEAQLVMAGRFDRAATEQDVQEVPGWDRVRFLGWQPRSALPGLLENARAGIVLFHPEPNHVEAMPNKLFEYMSAGLPVIASDFPLWRQIVEGAGCGMLVDPQDARAIAGAIEWMLTHPDEAEAMGRRGREAVVNTYNWDREAEKLIQLYQRLLA